MGVRLARASLLLFFQAHEVASTTRAPMGTRTTPPSNVTVLVVGIATHFCALASYGLTACVICFLGHPRQLDRQRCHLRDRGVFAGGCLVVGVERPSADCAMSLALAAPVSATIAVLAACVAAMT